MVDVIRRGVFAATKHYQLSMNNTPETSRRDFLKTSATLGATALAFPSIMSAAPNSDKLRIGLIGCGGRGTGAANQALSADSNVELVAMGDLYADKLEKSLEGLKTQHGEKVKVNADKKFTGLDAYQKVLDCGIDVVLLAAPGGFRSRHLAASVAAGKHIFCEKPMAIDGPGIRSVLKSIEIAKQKKLALRAGFCFRFDNTYRETVKRIHDGEIGNVLSVFSTRMGGTLSTKFPGNREPGWTDLQWQLNNWSNFVWLSGDWMMEVAVHSVDKINWIMRDEQPIKCIASGGRQVPTFGSIYDHFDVVWEYADGRRTMLKTRYQDHSYKEHADYIQGDKGKCVIGRKPKPEIYDASGKAVWRYSGEKGDMYQNEHDELFASIRSGNVCNDGDWMIKSVTMAIMGRMAAYTGQEITWEMAQNSQEDLYPKNLAWDMKLDVPPLASPGVTKYF
jgi:myo-inositol 2-dehydrogenase / D-chiro-inositol 1-dehydrogenase